MFAIRIDNRKMLFIGQNLCSESNAFKCVTNENCVLYEWLNDGDDDCGDESDEGMCVETLKCCRFQIHV